MSEQEYFKSPYISNKDYYSYDDYIEWIKPIYKSFFSQDYTYPVESLNNDKCYIPIKIEEIVDGLEDSYFCEHEYYLDEEGLDNERMNWRNIEYDLRPFLHNYPVYCITPELLAEIDKTEDWERTENGRYFTLDYNKLFTDTALFLFPKSNTYKIKFITCIYDNCDIWVRFYYYNTSIKKYDVYESLIESFIEIIDDGSHSDVINFAFDSLIFKIFYYLSKYPQSLPENEPVKYNGAGKGYKESKGGLLTSRMLRPINQKPEQSSNPVPNPSLQGIKKCTHERRGHWRRLRNGQSKWIPQCTINSKKNS